MSGRDDRVVITNTESIGEEVAEKLGGKTGGRLRGSKVTLADLLDEIGELEEDISSLSDDLEALEDLRGDIKNLERRVVEIETEKARAKKEAKKEVSENLRKKAEKKRKKYEKKLTEVLGDYKDRIDRLKDRFLNSITHKSESFEDVTAEFDRMDQSKRQSCEETDSLGNAAANGHEKRLKAVTGSKKEFVESINSFLNDREETADLIESLQTEVRGIDGKERLQVPFWVVGVEKNGTEEMMVYPMLDIGKPESDLTDASPYADYLSEHPKHSYGDMTDIIKGYVQRDSVRSRLSADDSRFADPSVLKSRGAANDRFIQSLVEHELSDRKVTNAESGSSKTGKQNRKSSKARGGKR